MSNIKFYIPKGQTIPLTLWLNVDGIEVIYNKVDSGYEFSVWYVNKEEAMKYICKEMGINVELIPKNNIKGMIDLRHTKRHQAKCLRELEKQFINKKSIKRLKIITKSGKTLDFEK